MPELSPESQRPRPSWYQASVLAAGSAILYQFSEWLFFATKLSFLSRVRWLERFEALFIAAAAVALVTAGVQLLMLPISYAAGKIAGRARAWTTGVAIIPSIILASLALIVLDNFTYVLFQFGIITSGSLGRLVYVVVFFTLIVLIARSTIRRFEDHEKSSRLTRAATIALVAVFALAVVTLAIRRDSRYAVTEAEVSGAGPRPNILLLASDGVSADHMSVYGYARDTTPFLRSLRERTLFFENAFPNVGRTYGSFISMLSGAAPESTKAGFAPNILLGDDSFQHLPGILRRIGYETAQVSMRYYADAPDANMLLAFDQANYREIDHRVGAFVRRHGLSSVTPSLYLVSQSWERITDRIKHIFGVRRMEDAYSFVVDRPEAAYYSDTARIDEITRFIHEAREPWFLHVHLMDTHCCGFAQGRQLNQQELATAYDLSIRKGDRYFAAVFEELRKAGQLDSTVVVISSDHNLGWDPRARVPLMIYFPNGAIRGTSPSNVQLLDVAPTILDFMNIEAPEWMTGSSLLEPMPPSRPIHSLHRIDSKTQLMKDLRNVGPPHFGALTAVVIICDRWYELNLRTGAIRSEPIPGHAGGCMAPPMEEARKAIIDHLRSNGFEDLPTTSGKKQR